MGTLRVPDVKCPQLNTRHMLSNRNEGADSHVDPTAQ